MVISFPLTITDESRPGGEAWPAESNMRETTPRQMNLFQGQKRPVYVSVQLRRMTMFIEFCLKINTVQKIYCGTERRSITYMRTNMKTEYDHVYEIYQDGSDGGKSHCPDDPGHG